MGYINGDTNEKTSGSEGAPGPPGPSGTGFKLTQNGNFDLENKKLTSVAEGTESGDAVTKHQLEVGLSTKPNPTDVILVDGTTHMTGDLDLRGNKLILPGGIEMNRKIITNLDTDENDDLSAVNMITLKKFHPDAPAHTHEVLKNIDLKGNFNVVQSKPQTTSDLIQHYNNLFSFNDAKNCFVARGEGMPVLPMKIDLDLGGKTIFNVKTPTGDDQGVNKKYVDDEVNTCLPKSGGTMTGGIYMNNNRIFNLPNPTGPEQAATKLYVDHSTTKKADKTYVDDEIATIQKIKHFFKFSSK